MKEFQRVVILMSDVDSDLSLYASLVLNIVILAIPDMPVYDPNVGRNPKRLLHNSRISLLLSRAYLKNPELVQVNVVAKPSSA